MRWMFFCWSAILGVACATQAGSAEPIVNRIEVRKLHDAGNFAEAYAGYRQLALSADDEPREVGGDLQMGVNCLQRLGRVDEIDEFREAVVKVHGQNWRLLQTAAATLLHGEHHGFLIAGEFRRGGHRGGGEMVNALERDRVRALQLLVQALPRLSDEPNRTEAANFYFDLASQLMGNRGYAEAWRLQTLTDLAVLPDYDQGWYFGGLDRGAPVDESGRPVFHQLPATWAAAQSDGQRWKWAIAQSVETDAQQLNRARWTLAEFAQNQFGEQTMAYYGWFFGRVFDQDDTRQDESGTYELQTLHEGETIARLATGIKRFALPDDYNYLALLKQVVAEPQTGYAELAIDRLAQVFENRRQYPRAADWWRQAIAKFGPGNDNYRQQRLDQIVGNWGRFEPLLTQPAGRGATIDFRFRNGKRVEFEAHSVNVERLLTDVKNYLKSRPRQLDWEQMNIADVGYSLVTKNRREYLGDRVASWELALDPRERHVDRRITVATPLQKAGAYLVTARMADGNTSQIVVWISDTAIVKKPLVNKHLFYVADGVNGQPIPRANVEFFGWRQRHVKDNEYQIDTLNFAELSDASGQVTVDAKRAPPEYQWLATARGAGGRMAFLGFTNIWCPPHNDQAYNESKVFVITDRPVYRPQQTVKFKFWVRQAKYDQEEASSFAAQPFTVEIRDPQGEKLRTQQFTSDEYGGFDGEFALPAEAKLGVYQLALPDGRGGSFRVEEYKKPEYEVTVAAPHEPVMLGEKATAKIAAKYYFGGPVTQAKVKYKIVRTDQSSDWYPLGIWDWFYGPGYWWFAGDYPWYPGWRDWGCRRPTFWWIWRGPRQPPEIVAEGEAPLGEDGTLSVEIDTAVAKAIHPDRDHSYQVTAEVVDQSRRTIVGAGSVLVARKPFRVFAWVDHGYYRTGDAILAQFSARRLDGQPVAGAGVLKLLSIRYERGKPVEQVVEQWNLATDEQGHAQQQIQAGAPGQFRLAYSVTDQQGHTIEGGYLLTVIGPRLDSDKFRFNDIELLAEKREYAPGEKVRLLINTDRSDAAVLLFVRPASGVYLAPKLLRLKGKSAVEEIEVAVRDMPNFFVEVLTVSNGKVHSDTREIVVPPEKRVLNVEVLPSAATYRPGEKAQVDVKLTDLAGRPFVGSTVAAIFDKSVEYVSGGSNVPEIKAFFWKWRRQHQPQGETSLARGSSNLVQPQRPWMQNIGIFGEGVADEASDELQLGQTVFRSRSEQRGMALFKGAWAARSDLALDVAAPAPLAETNALADFAGAAAPDAAPGAGGPLVEPTVRTKFADTAYWAGSLTTDQHGVARIELDMPENLTTWKIRFWGMGRGAQVGQGDAEVITRKDLLVRLQTPRFLVEQDEVTITANVHNFLEKQKSVSVRLELDGPCLLPLGDDADGLTRQVDVAAGGEARVDFRLRVAHDGEAVVRVKALTDQESDAMELRVPSYVHGLLKTESWAGAIRLDRDRAAVKIRVPEARRPQQSRLEIRYSPSLAAAMVDALPYLVEYPYESTDQTLDRFLPTVISHRILLEMGLDLKAIRDKRTNLNAQELGDAADRARGWRHWQRNPVFDPDEVREMVKQGVQKLGQMQLADGGWGWFYGWAEHSWADTTAYVVQGLLQAQKNDVALVPGVLDRGVAWLVNHRNEQVRLLKNAPSKTQPWKNSADNLDAFVYLVLVDAGQDDAEMREFLYRDRNQLSVYAKAMFALALHAMGDAEKLAMIQRNLQQFLVQDDENQTAFLKLPEGAFWWYWYNNEAEANAYYLKLLARTDPQGETAGRLAKYVINNRKHATYWNSTRDTAISIEALAEYLRASGEGKPEMTVEVLIDGASRKRVAIDAESLFTFDNQLVLEGMDVASGEHQIELRRSGRGPLYFNVYLTNFTLEDPIAAAGLEVKVDRKVYLLEPVQKRIKAAGSRGQAVDQRVEKFERRELPSLAEVKSGQLVEIELEIDSKNDYEYLLFEDYKPAGLEAASLRSGYNGNALGAYMELRDNRVTFFVRQLARGKHSVNYRLRAETPGRFSALPAVATGVYAPELRANSHEFKLRVVDE